MKRSIALAVFHPLHPGRVVAVKRPPWDADLPGVWGLPAVSLRLGESPYEAIERCATSKLGLQVHPWEMLGEGWQEGPSGPQILALWAVQAAADTLTLPTPKSGDAVTLYTAWQWGSPSLLDEAARRGSLCCRLFLAWSAACDPGQREKLSL